MMKIGFDNLEIPTSWREIKLSDYEKWYMMNPQTKKELVHYTAKVCNLDVSILLDSPPALFQDIFNTIQFVFDSEIEALQKLEISKVDYFIPKFNKLTFGEYVDVDSVLNSESDSKLSEIMAIVCRPIGEKYNPDNEELNLERIEIFKNLTCDKALPLLSFFFLNSKESDRITSRYLMVTEQIDLLLHHIRGSALSGDGTKRLRIWQGIKYYFLMRSLKKQLSKFSAFSSIE